MSNNKFRNSYSESLNAGVLAELEIDLATQGFGGKNAIDVTGFSICSVTVQTVGASGSAGVIKLLQANEVGSGFEFQAPVSIPIGSDVSNGAFDVPISTAYIMIDHSGATLGTVGKIKIKVAAKRGGANGSPYISSVSGGTTSVISILESDGVLSLDDNVTTGGFIEENTTLWLKIENISPSVVAAITTESDNIALQPGESFYEEMQKLDKIYRQARVEYNPGEDGLLRITKKLRT